MSRLKWIVLALVILAVVVVYLFTLEDVAEVKEATAEQHLPLVSVVSAQPADHGGRLQVFAEVRPRWAVDLKAGVNGKVVSVLPSALEGARVEKGEELILLEDSPYKAALDEAEHALSQAKFQVVQRKIKTELARKEWDRFEQKSKPTEIALHLPELRIAEKAVVAAESRVESARTNYEETRIRAPFSGFITRRNVSIGQTVSVGDSLLEMIDDRLLDITVSLSEAEWAILDKDWRGSEAEILDAGGNVVAMAEIRRGGGFLDPKTRQYKLYLQIRNDDMNKALSGQFVQVRLPGITASDSLKLPESALTRDGYVWYLDGDDRLRRFDADIVFRVDNEITVKTPDQDGDARKAWRVATTPLAAFIPGQKVEPSMVGQ